MQDEKTLADTSKMNSATVLGLALIMIMPMPAAAGLQSRNNISSTTKTEVMLADGHTSMEGTLLVRFQQQESSSWSEWGLVCDDGWSTVSADIACRQLGFGQALEYTVANKFQTDLTGKRILLDDVRCAGSEASLTGCRSRPPGEHNCEASEAAGVRCAAASRTVELNSWQRPVRVDNKALREDLTKTPAYRLKLVPKRANTSSMGSEKATSGLVVATLNNTNKSQPSAGGICADSYVTLREASVVCRELDLGVAKDIWKDSAEALLSAGAVNVALTPLLSVAGCRGGEASLRDCAQFFGSNSSEQLPCMEPNATLGVTCTADLPDLVLDHRVLQLSAYVARVPMYYINCALEENCAAPTAFEVRDNNPHWPYAIRTLLRFSTIVSNIGSSDFHPYNSSESWTWHTCHMHYHSMPYFAAYEIYQQRNNTHQTLASGHKASFCLEDSACKRGVEPKYQCSRDPWDTGNQGISVGCSDNYLHDLDCQWIDITDLPFGFYMFRVVLNPEFKSAELNYANNAVICRLVFSPYQAQLHSCRVKHAFDV